MNWLIIKNDLKRNKAINLALLMFMIFSACLAALSAVMAVQTFTSISELYEKARPPHFVQMHKGEIDTEKIDEFMSGYKGITNWQTVTMIDVYGDDLTVAGSGKSYSLSDCRLDIGLVKQNDVLDLLMDSQHKKVKIGDGEIGMPVILKNMYGMEYGDRIRLEVNGISKEFVIREFILDSMMNSTMCSSTRILLSDNDFNTLNGQIGENEYLIEAYFTDKKEAASFQTAYENAGLPRNGQAITYTIIFILSALTDIVTVFVLLLASLLLILVALICVRFTIIAALEEEIGEIGTMKAIGMPFGDIRSLYLGKYRVMAIAGGIIGYASALLLSRIFTNHISATFGNMPLSPLALVLSFVISCIVYLLISGYCKRLLKKIRKLTVVDALVSGKGFDRDKGRVKDGLHKSGRLSVNWLMGMREVTHRFRDWKIVFIVVLIAVMMILIPVNLMNTFEAPEFITYMGSSLEDILIEVENGEGLEENSLRVRELLDNDADIESYYEYRRVCVQTEDVDKELINLHIDAGSMSGHGLRYLSGEAPRAENEIAVSFLNAEKIGKADGDTIILVADNKPMEFVISGIYQDVTSGGFTAKSRYEFNELASEKYTYSVNIKDDKQAESKADEWSEALGTGITVDPMREFIGQTLGGVAKQLKSMVLAIVIVSVCLSILLCVLFLRLRLAKDVSAIAVLKAIGFTERDIRKLYLIKIGCAAAAGITMGVAFTELLGEGIVNGALGIAGIGVKQVDLISNWAIELIICPVLMIFLILLVTGLTLNTVKKYNIISFNK